MTENNSQTKEKSSSHTPQTQEISQKVQGSENEKTRKPYSTGEKILIGFLIAIGIIILVPFLIFMACLGILSVSL